MGELGKDLVGENEIPREIKRSTSIGDKKAYFGHKSFPGFENRKQLRSGNADLGQTQTFPNSFSERNKNR